MTLPQGELSRNGQLRPPAHTLPMGDHEMDPTFAALLGATLGGALSVVASWLAQRVQSKSQVLTLEIQRRQQLYSDFVKTAARCFADALQESEPNAKRLARLYGAIGRMRVQSSVTVIKEANRIAHRILETFGASNRTKSEIRDFLARDSTDLFSDFGDACRAELMRLQPHRIRDLRPLNFRIAPQEDLAWPPGTMAEKA